MSTGPTSGERERLVRRFENEFKEFRSLFPSQTPTFFRTIKAASKSVLREKSPLKPGVILLASSHRPTLDCIARRVASLSSAAYGSRAFVDISKGNLSAFEDHSEVKKYLERELRAGLTSGETIDITMQVNFKLSFKMFKFLDKVALIEDIDAIDGRAFMLFHAFCDNEHAPFKDSIIIFTLETTDVQSDTEVRTT